MKKKEKLIDVIKQFIIEPYQELILNEIKSSIRLKTISKACKTIGNTKLGGLPDFPKKMNWPKSKFNQKYLSFLGQINLNEIQEYDEKKLLPSDGILYFFFNLDSGDDGEVIFSKEVNELEKANPPRELENQKKSFIQKIINR